MKIKYDNNFVELIRLYSKFNNEVGGMIFGKNLMNHLYRVNTISLKKGQSTSISFGKKDEIIYNIPHNSKKIGTWHLHPVSGEAIPSNTDLKQWNNWDKTYIHIICTKIGFKVFTSKGVCIHEKFF